MAIAEGHPDAAGEMLTLAEVLMDSIGAKPSVFEASFHDRVAAAVRAKVPPLELERVRSELETAEVGEAVSFVLRYLD